MSLFETLKKDRIVHFKKRNDDPISKIAYAVLGVLISDASRTDKEPNDITVISYVKKFIENAKITKENSKDHFTTYSAETEITFLEGYLPKQLDEASIRTLMAPFKGQGIGIAMKYFKDNYAGQYDGALVSKIAKEIL